MYRTLRSSLVLIYCLTLIHLSDPAQAQRITAFSGGQIDGKLANEVDIANVSGLVFAPDGDLIILQFSPNNVIRRIDMQTGMVSRILGTGHYNNKHPVEGELAINADMSSPQEVAADAAGNIYFSHNSIITRISAATGVVNRFAGVNNFGEFAGDGGPALNAKFNSITGIAIDASNNMYIADLNNYRIRKIDGTTGIVSTIAGNGTQGPSGDGGPALSAGLIPGELHLAGNFLYISDYSHHRVVKINLTTGIISLVAGTGTSGFTGDGGAGSSAKLNTPLGLTSDGTYLYICDTYNHRVRRVHLTSGTITTFAGTGTGAASADATAATTNLWMPQAIGRDANGNIIVTETGGRKIRSIDPTGVVTTIAGNGGFGGDGGPAINATLLGPDHIVFDLNGNIVLSDRENHRIRKIMKATGLITTIAGGVKGFSGDGGLATAAKLDGPGAMAIDAAGNLFIRERGNYRIRKIDAVSGNISTIAGTGTPGATGDAGLATAATISESGGIALDGAGNIYIAQPEFHKIRKITKTTGIITTIAGTGVGGGTGDNGLAVNAQINAPRGVAVDASNNIYITVLEFPSGKIRRVDGVTGIITTIAGGPSTGGWGGGPALETYLPEIGAISVSGPDKLLFNSYGRVMELNLTTSMITVIAGSGQDGYYGDGGPATSALLDDPSSIIKDADGNYFIADAPANRIRKVSPPVAQTITFNALPAVTFGDAPLDLSAFASASSGLEVWFQSSDLQKATIIGGPMLKIVRPGTLDITAHQGGDDGFLPATSVTRQLVIGKGIPVIAINSAKKGRAGSSVELIPHKGNSDGTATFSITNGTGTATVSGTTLQLLTPGTVTLTLTLSEGSDYLQATTQQVITIEKPLPALTLTSRSNGIAGQVIPLTVDKGGSTGAVTYSVELINGNATIAGSNLTLVGAGTIAVTASIAEDPSFAATSITDLITIVATDTQANMPQIWGTTSSGGPTNGGVIFRMNADGTGYRVMKEFRRDSRGSSSFYGKMIPGVDGKLYGTMPSGGKYNSGVLFKYDPATAQYTVLHHFAVTSASPSSGLCLASDGNFYGTTEAGGANQAGVVYRFNPSTGAWTIIGDLSSDGTGRYAHGGLVEAGGMLYGISSAGGANGSGAVFKVNPATGTLSIVLPLTMAQGMFSYAGLAVGPNGKLYGLSSQAGAHGMGTIYEIDPITPSITTKVDLPSPASSTSIVAMTLAANNKFYFTAAYGDNYGTIMEYVPGSTAVTKKYSFGSCCQGAVLFGGLTKAPNGKLYGLAANGGQYSSSGGFGSGGTLYEFNPADAAVNALYHFNTENGIFPAGTMAVIPDGTLFGTTLAGGPGNGGVLFSFKPSTNQFIREVDLGSTTDSFNPSGSVAMLNGKLFGMARGANGSIIWEYDVATGVYKKRRNFDLAGSGANGFMLHEGKLFGAAQNGGFDSNGSLYEFNPTNGELTTRKSFVTANGVYPNGNLQSVGSKIYGTTTSGGTNGNGTVFSYEPATNAFTAASLPADMGLQSRGVALASDGLLYGVAMHGGANGVGTVYRFNPTGSVFTKLKDFSSAEGAFPDTRLTPGNTGKLYGLTNGGGSSSSGVLYEIDPATGAYSVEVNFTVTPATLNLVRGYNGRLYGATAGSNGSGIFEFIPSVFGDEFEQVTPFTGTTGHAPVGEWVFVKASQTIAFDPITPVQLFGSPEITLAATSSSGLSVTYTSSDPGTAEVTGNIVRFFKAGTVTITASQGGDSNFNPATPVARELVIGKAAQTIVFFPMTEKKAGEIFEPTVVTTSDLDITLTSANTDIASIEGNKIKAKAVGTVVITATQAGDANFLPATPVTSSLTIVIGDQTITFEAPADKTMGFTPFNLVATASSGLPVVFTSTSDKVAISGTTLTGVKPGRPVIKAEQPGNASFTAAPAVERSFCIYPAKPTIAVTLQSGNATLTSSAESGNQWSLGGTAIAGATNKTLTVTEPGIYTVISKIDDCASVPSDGSTVVITGVEDIMSGLRLYPNPASETLIVEQRSAVDERVTFMVTDMLGRVILERNAHTNTEEIIDLRNISQGAYLLKAVSSEGNVVQRFNRR